MKPKELREVLQSVGMEVRFCQGMSYDYLRNRFSWSADDSVNYSLTAVKPLALQE